MQLSRRAPGARDDSGFSLVEVVVAVVLVAAVFASASIFFVSGISTAAGLQRRDAAVAVADTAMDFVRTVPAQQVGSAAGAPRLLTGRSQAAVEAHWDSALTELATTSRGWDAGASGPAAVDPTCFGRAVPQAGQPVVPLRSTCSRGGLDYTVDVYIGTCLQPSGTAPCTNTAGTVGVPHYRVVVAVSWDEGAGTSCSGAQCRYLLTTLVNGDGDLLFNTTADETLPVAQQRSATTPHGTEVTIQLVTDATGLRPSPVTIATPPTNGTLVGVTTGGSVRYRPNPGFSGVDEFTYTVTNTSDRVSTPAKVLVTVQAPAVPAAPPGGPVQDVAPTATAACLAVGFQSGSRSGTADLATTSAPAGGTTRTVAPLQRWTFTVNGSVVTAVSQGNVSLPASTSYTVTDTSGRSASATLVVKESCP